MAGLTTNLSALTTGASAAASLASLALVLPQSTNPTNTKGYQPINALDADGNIDLSADQPDPLIFHYEGENSVTIESDITDHYVEDNTTIIDQIGLKPEIVTVSGFIGELNDILPSFLQPLQTIANTLVTIDGYTPQLSATALIDFNEAVLQYNSLNSALNSAIGAWSSISSLVSGEDDESGQVGGETGVFQVGADIVQNKQQQMFQQFYGYWNNRVLFNVQTPWAIFTNMAIKTLRPIQDAETRMITNFEITFKKIRTASTFVEAATISQGRTASQSAGETDLGTSAGTPGSSLGGNISATQ